MSNKQWPNRTFWNWVKWNFRGRPTVVMTLHCYGTLHERDSEEISFVPDYLVDDWSWLNFDQGTMTKLEPECPGERYAKRCVEDMK